MSICNSSSNGNMCGFKTTGIVSRPSAAEPSLYMPMAMRLSNKPNEFLFS